jgi:hypothetical protein
LRRIGVSRPGVALRTANSALPEVPSAVVTSGGRAVPVASISTSMAM